MAVRIRLRRIGKRKQPQYRVVVAEAKGPRDGRFIESIGHYNPRVEPPVVSLNEERALWWLQHGARPSETAKAMMVKSGLWEKFTKEAVPAVSEHRAPPPAQAPEQEEAAPPVAPEPAAAGPAEAGDRISEDSGGAADENREGVQTEQ